ncbi:MAG: tetratricopeptide repeat protein [Marinicella sp.]|nr:tetratricopeptide repeat protein [Xanthomonadales bacterium]
MKNRLTFWLLAMVTVLFASSCSQHRPIDINDDIRDPSEHEQSVIQIAPMVPEAVQILLQEAESQQQHDQIEQALLTLKRALSISPGSALVQQHLAELYLAEGDYQQAFGWSNRVFQQGPTHGSVCERARRTLALAAEMLNDVETQAQALESISDCTLPAPKKY